MHLRAREVNRLHATVSYQIADAAALAVSSAVFVGVISGRPRLACSAGETGRGFQVGSNIPCLPQQHGMLRPGPDRRAITHPDGGCSGGYRGRGSLWGINIRCPPHPPGLLRPVPDRRAIAHPYGRVRGPLIKAPGAARYIARAHVN